MYVTIDQGIWPHVNKQDNYICTYTQHIRIYVCIYINTQKTVTGKFEGFWCYNAGYKKGEYCSSIEFVAAFNKLVRS